VSFYDKKGEKMNKRHPLMINRSDPPLAKGVRDLKKSWEPVLSPASLKAELERRKELSDTRSELERRLMAFRSLRLRNFPIMRGSVERTKPSSPLSMSA
jgi:hypothetical protein